MTAKLPTMNRLTFFLRELAENYATGSADITIRVLDHSGALIPDIKRTVSVGL